MHRAQHRVWKRIRGQVDYAKSALSTAYRMAEEVLSHYVDENANLFYQTFFTYFQIYLLEPNLEEASFVLNRALEFLNERVDAQRAKRGENTAIALVDVDAREQIMLYKAGLLSAQGERLEALRFSDWVADSHGERRRKRADGCRDVFDRFYMEALAFSVLAILRAEGGRTPRADGQIGEMLRESVHIAEDLKLITLDHARADAICDMQDWANLIFSYWVEFPDHTISAEDLYQFELNTKNIDPHIRFLQNRALQSGGGPSERDAVNRERRELWGNYQKEAIEKAFAANHGSVEVVRGRDARKDNVFAAGADILHFATHGFAILNQLEESSREPGRPDGFLHSERARRIASSDNALLRCGLLLSGVDNWLRGAEADGFGNGILTGMDILSESLGDYRLVVLSACGTGQGAAAYSGEGIEGLRSAFELAGVPVLVCTLWDVDDFATALFMAEFYRDLQRGGSPLSALQAAKCALQSMTYADLEREGFQTQADSLFQRRMALSKEERPFAHPRYWASFILHGAALEA